MSQKEETKEVTLKQRVEKLEGTLVELLKHMATMKAELERQSANMDTLQKAIYALGSNDKTIGEAIQQLQQASGLPVLRKFDRTPN